MKFSCSILALYAVSMCARAQVIFIWSGNDVFFSVGKVFNSFVECLMKRIKAWARHRVEWVEKKVLHLVLFCFVSIVKNWPNAWVLHLSSSFWLRFFFLFSFPIPLSMCVRISCEERSSFYEHIKFKWTKDNNNLCYFEQNANWNGFYATKQRKKREWNRETGWQRMQKLLIRMCFMIRKMIYHVNNNVVFSRFAAVFFCCSTSLKEEIVFKIARIAHTHSLEDSRGKEHVCLCGKEKSLHWLPIFMLDFTGTKNKRECTKNHFSLKIMVNIRLKRIFLLTFFLADVFFIVFDIEPLNWINAHAGKEKYHTLTHIQTHLIKLFLLLFLFLLVSLFFLYFSFAPSQPDKINVSKLSRHISYIFVSWKAIQLVMILVFWRVYVYVCAFVEKHLSCSVSIFFFLVCLIRLHITRW